MVLCLMVYYVEKTSPVLVDALRTEMSAFSFEPFAIEKLYE